MSDAMHDGARARASSWRCDHCGRLLCDCPRIPQTTDRDDRQLELELVDERAGDAEGA